MSKATAIFTDFYQITMMYGYFKEGKHKQRAIYNGFFRKNPFQNGYTLMAGLNEAIEYLSQLRFTREQIDYLQQFPVFQDDEFLKYLQNFRFTGDFYAMPEGTVAFPNEPFYFLDGNLPEVQLVETAIENIFNLPTLIATKASRIRHAAGENALLLEFGTRRAQGIDAANNGTRASLIGGFDATANTEEAARLGITPIGTHAHAWIQSFPSELEAFQAWMRNFPNNGILLVDTYHVKESGIPNAIRVFQEFECQKNGTSYGIRIDSGDLAYLSKYARNELDRAGLFDAKIVISSDLNEELITNLKWQGAQVDSYGVGTNLITAEGTPALGNVHKLVAIEEDGILTPKIKVSENPIKVTNPDKQKVLRFFNCEGEAIADLITRFDEVIPVQPFEIFDPVHTEKRKIISNARCEELLVPIFKKGELVYHSPSLHEIQKNTQNNLDTFSEEHRRLVNPHTYHVDLSPSLWDLKMKLLHQ